MRRKVSLLLVFTIIFCYLFQTVSVEAYNKSNINYGFRDTEKVKFISKDIYNLEYIEYREDGTYKISEKMSENFMNLKSKVYKLDETTKRYVLQKEIGSVIENGNIIQKTVFNGKIEKRVYNLPKIEVSNFKKDGFSEIRISSSEKWYTSVKEGNTYVANATISAIIQMLGAVVGEAVGGVVGAAIGAGLATVAQKIFDRKVKSVDFVVTTKWRYDYPYYYYRTSTKFYDEDNGDYLGSDYVEGKIAITM